MMKRLLPFALAITLLPCLARAQASVQLRLDLPVVLPPMVVVSPGVRVVQDVDEEVFFVDGFYWARHDGGWYRARNHRGGWAYVGPRGVPRGLVQVPPGKYRRWHREAPPQRAYARPAPAPAPWRAARGGLAPVPVRGERYDRNDDRGHGGHDNGNGKKKGHDKH